MLTTTLPLLKKHLACDGRYAFLVAALRQRKHRGAIPLSLILEVNGFDDALWALRAVPTVQIAERDRIARLFACDCVQRVLPLFEQKFPDDRRPRQAVVVARRFVAGKATVDELTDAGNIAIAMADDFFALDDATWTVVRAAWRVTAVEIARSEAWTSVLNAFRYLHNTVDGRLTAINAETRWQAARLRKYLTK